MKKAMITSPRLEESYARIDHPSGLTMLLCPMKGYSSTYALFATKYGSVDTCFKTDKDDDFVQVPAGIAHFLEHKLFENEDGDAFARYAKTGANANAYTSFDRTAYLFSCSENFPQSLEVLLELVTSPYFTPESVQKEQGIIGQEIRMYDDDADWRVFFNLLGALYHNNPVKIDIAGTVDSIAKIDADLLYRCYHTFYNMHNMVLAIAGNFTVDSVLEVADRILKPTPNNYIQRKSPDEPGDIVRRRAEQNLPVAVPLFQMGFKGQTGSTDAETFFGQIQDELLLEIIAGESTPLYRKLYDQGLINQTFGTDAMASRDFCIASLGGESRDPDKVFQAVVAEVERLQKEGIDQSLFSRCKKAAWGRYVGMYGRVESVASLLVVSHFAGVDLYTLLDAVAGITLEDVTARLKNNFDVNRCALSVIRSA